jgi:hypothetical protein
MCVCNYVYVFLYIHVCFYVYICMYMFVLLDPLLLFCFVLFCFVIIDISRGGHNPLHALKPTTHTQNHSNKTNTVIHQ